MEFQKGKGNQNLGKKSHGNKNGNGKEFKEHNLKLGKDYGIS